MNISKYLRFSVFVLAALTFVACENDDDDDDDTPSAVNEEELITDLRLTFTSTFDQSETTFIFSDTDGPGGSDPLIDDIVLSDSTAYSVSIEVLDASNPNDVEDITEEIAEEDEEHQFFFIPGSGAESTLTIAYDPTELDDDGNPIGLSSVWTTLDATPSGATVRVVLRHELDKAATGVSDGDITNAGGETDIDVTFNVSVN
jgi:hypothetical protein